MRSGQGAFGGDARVDFGLKGVVERQRLDNARLNLQKINHAAG